MVDHCEYSQAHCWHEYGTHLLTLRGHGKRIVESQGVDRCCWCGSVSLATTHEMILDAKGDYVTPH